MQARALTTGLLLMLSSLAQANIKIEFDYSYDTAGFFTSQGKSVLGAAAAAFETRFADSLAAIDSAGGNDFAIRFFDPANPFAPDIILSQQDFATDVIRVYVGAANLGSSTLGLGGPGGYSCGGFGTFCTDAISRGQGTVTGGGATDFALWGGNISFSNTASWYFGTDASGITPGQSDFYSVAIHELAHVLGFGTADSFSNLVGGGMFNGPTTGAVVLHDDDSHWAAGTMSLVSGNAQEAAMNPTILKGTRKYFTDLDYAAMQDIGWQVTPVPEAETWAMLLAGLGLVGLAARSRKR
ncbi:MAG TPA: PEP-CTERM sorting domain-containing protein [Thiobacillaceae bacterium]|nr:PEP-CTERM sorting domain-containing protein [Thiobacillaceae bacterium]HNU62959.1 PEP-CTERM sorting domain-containing protein [Thiobacillaceae bacterium]